ncbi:MAG TPA: hypothetical protein VMU43_10765 [Candidatus Acidoferrum sp.]|nr:hypothetical protein [Candidatus Acidoferrum sp.]
MTSISHARRRRARGRFLAPFVAAFCLSSLVSLTSLGREKSENGLASDKGKLRILVNGMQAGEEEYDISQGGGGWVAHGSSQLQTAQGTEKVSGTLSLRDDGTPIHYEWNTQGAKRASSTVDFNGTSVTAELHLEGMRPYTQQFTFNSPRILVLDNNLYHQYDIVARLYNWEKKGPQTFSVLVPQEMTPGSITVDSVGKQDFNGKNCDELVVKTEDLMVNVYVDGPRLIGIVVPASAVEILRE